MSSRTCDWERTPLRITYTTQFSFFRAVNPFELTSRHSERFLLHKNQFSRVRPPHNAFNTTASIRHLPCKHVASYLEAGFFSLPGSATAAGGLTSDAAGSAAGSAVPMGGAQVSRSSLMPLKTPVP
jgi:hypothetical protein